MNSLVKVPPYSKLNFQGKHFFTQDWCNITLKLNGIDAINKITKVIGPKTNSDGHTDIGRNLMPLTPSREDIK
jgi:hypothetical protein